MNPVYAIGRTPPVYCGPGELDQLATLIGTAGAVLLVYDAGIAATDVPRRVRDALGDGIPIHPFIAPAGEPTVETVNAAAHEVRALNAPAVIGLGGGTPLDIAKLAAALQLADDGIEPFLLGAGTLPGRAPLVTIPTTAGTGSEITRTCILSDSAARKLWVWSDVLSPDAVILDPSLTVSLPWQLTISTGLDAFAHALEACTGQACNRVNEACALQAIRLSTGALERAAHHPDDLDARQSMQEAALLAGMAIDSGGTGIAHTIGHALGSLYHVPHGIAVALGLQASLRWSVEGETERYRAAAEHFDGGIPAIEWGNALDTWLDHLGFAAAVSAAAPERPDPHRLAAAMQAEENRPMTLNNARTVTSRDIHEIAARTCELWAFHTGQQAVRA